MYYTHEFHPLIFPIIILPNHSCTPPRTTPMHPQYTTITPPHPHNTPGILNPRIGARHLPRHTPPRNNTILHNAIRNHYGLQYFTFDPDGVVVDQKAKFLTIFSRPKTTIFREFGREGLAVAQAVLSTLAARHASIVCVSSC